jgi:hypothetical protein
MLHMAISRGCPGMHGRPFMHYGGGVFLGLHVQTLLASTIATPSIGTMPISGLVWPPKSRPPSRASAVGLAAAVATVKVSTSPYSLLFRPFCWLFPTPSPWLTH